MKSIIVTGLSARTVRVTLLIFGGCLFSLLTFAGAVVAQQPFEAPPVLSAKYLLPADMVSGPLFRVDDQVPTDGLRGLFTLRSDLGTFTVPGRELLKIRIAELPAIKHLEAQSKTDVFLKAAGNAAARPVEAAENIAKDPVGTAKSIPGGVSRLWGRVEAGASNVAKSVTDSDKSTDQKAQETAQRVGDVTITALGFEQVHRQLAKSLGVDPYTTNPVLSKKLTDTAWVAFSGRLGIDVLTTAFVPASTAISLTSFTSDLVYDTPKADLLVMNKEKMIAMGASDAQAQALLGNRWFSLTVLTALVTELESLAQIAGRPEVIALAATARNEEDARFLASSVHLLARLNVTGVSIREMKAGGTVIGIAPAGHLVVPAPADYISWTDRIGSFAERPDLKTASRAIWLTGRMSGAAHKGFTRLGWTVQEVPQSQAGR
jgi:hypothetical protein